MLGFPAPRLGRVVNNLAATPAFAPPGVRLTASSTPHAKGAWAALYDNLPYDVFGFELVIGGSRANATRTDMMLDLAIGPAGGGSEQVIVPELLCGWRDLMLTSSHPWFFPIFLPAGKRLSGRIQALIGSDTLETMVFLHSAASCPFRRLFRRVHAYGTSAASSIGTSHTPGASGSESTAANVGSTLSRDYDAVMCMVQGALADTDIQNAVEHWELVINSMVRAEWWTAAEAGERLNGPYPASPIALSLVAGTQLQVRAESSIASPEAKDVAFYCFY